VRVEGTPRHLTRPIVVELVPPSNIAVGTVPWGLGSWVPGDSIRRISTGTSAADPSCAAGPGRTRTAAPVSPAELAGAIGAVVDSAAGRSLVIVVRDAHRHPAVRQIASRLLAARPDAVIVEMGLPVWRPPAEVYIATYGAARASGQAAAEILGLTGL
jgi:beta-N-acetylhexosaminidase